MNSTKKILITGAGGFIGSHLVEECVKRGQNVKTFVHYNSAGHWGWLDGSNCKDKIEVVMGDVRDYDSVSKAMVGCDSVIHLAALIGIPYSYTSPLAYIQANILGTYNVLESAKNLGILKVITTSTSETYGTAQFVPINEKHPSVGQSPYSASKIAADQLAISYYKSFGLPVKIVRPFNTYGPRQSTRAIIPTIISQLLNGKNTIKLGSLSPMRDFTYVKDTVNGFIEIFNSNKLFGEATNIGMNQEISISELVVLIGKLMNIKVEVSTDNTRVRPDKSEVERLVCDNSKIVKNTLWKPKYNLEKGLNETIKWFKKNKHLYNQNVYMI